MKNNREPASAGTGFATKRAHVLFVGLCAAGLAVAFLTAAVFATASSRPGAGEGKDRLAAEITRWSVYLKNNPRTDETWVQVRDVTRPVLGRAEEAIRAGRRLLALQRLSSVRVNLGASTFVEARAPGQRNDERGFEAEWTRMGNVLRADLAPPSGEAMKGVEPSAVRALGEAALPQIRAFYEASLEYGRNTMAESGFFYIGAAKAQKEFAELCRALSKPSGRRAPPLRALTADLDGLERELLAAYHPPASIDRHGEFIGASAALKEARELDRLGLRYGALLRYLQAALRSAPLAARPPSLDAEALDNRLRELDARLSAGETDHTIGRLLLESAQDESAASPGTASPVAAAIATDVLPRYFAALEPARPSEPKPAPRVTVTLVRWPYT